MIKKRVPIFLAVAAAVLLMTGCKANTSKSYTYSVETGDSIKVTLDTSDKYDITSELPFAVSHEGTTLSQGTFITAEGYEMYADAIGEDESAVILDTGSKDGNTYIFWSYNDTEYDYAVMIQDSNTGILIGNNVSEESARECFERLTFSIE